MDSSVRINNISIDGNITAILPQHWTYEQSRNALLHRGWRHNYVWNMLSPDMEKQSLIFHKDEASVSICVLKYFIIARFS